VQDFVNDCVEMLGLSLVVFVVVVVVEAVICDDDDFDDAVV
jgi:hypothetical protein